MMTKLVDVARAANVSVATVSRVLNSQGNVRPELADRVHAAVRELSYRPNAVARNLRRRGTSAWQLVVADIANPFYTALTRGVEDVANANGYQVLLGNSDEDPAREARYLEVAFEERVAGVIIAPQRPDAPVQTLLDHDIPLVAVNQSLRAKVDHVLADSTAGAQAATSHLIEGGWQRPACVTGPRSSETARLRADGYAAVMKAHDLEPLVRYSSFTEAGGRLGASSLLDNPEPPDAILACNAMIALGVLNELRDRSMTLGQDIGLISFDDTPWAELVHPSITVIAQRPYEMGMHAAKLLLTRLSADAQSSPVRIILETDLIERESGRKTIL